MGVLKNRIGWVYGKLTVLSRAKNKGRDVVWLCNCECGNTSEVSSSSLTTGNSKTCGRCVNMQKEKGVACSEYISWSQMKRRCYALKDKRYSHYGGRGIKVFEPWIKDFNAFLLHVGRKPTPQHSLDRIINNGNYEPGNVRWATCKEQNNNRSNSVFYTLNGETKTLPQWCEALNINLSRTRSRIASGKPFEIAILHTLPKTERIKKEATKKAGAKSCGYKHGYKSNAARISSVFC